MGILDNLKKDQQQNKDTLDLLQSAYNGKKHDSIMQLLAKTIIIMARCTLEAESKRSGFDPSKKHYVRIANKEAFLQSDTIAPIVKAFDIAKTANQNIEAVEYFKPLFQSFPQNLHEIKCAKIKNVGFLLGAGLELDFAVTKASPIINDLLPLLKEFSNEEEFNVELGFALNAKFDRSYRYDVTPLKENSILNVIAPIDEQMYCGSNSGERLFVNYADAPNDGSWHTFCTSVDSTITFSTKGYGKDIKALDFRGATCLQITFKM